MEMNDEGNLERAAGLSFEWYRKMVDEKTGRLVYIYDPRANISFADGSPIRDIASVWDTQPVFEPP